MTATKDISDTQVVTACVAAHRRDTATLADQLYALQANLVNGGQSKTACSLDVLVEMTGAPEKVCLRAMERADGRGLIDWGVNIRWAWPTPEGERLYREAQRP